MNRKRYDAVCKIYKINQVGISRIKRYVAAHHPNALPHFDRNMALIKDYMICGGEYVSQKYGVTRTAGAVMLRTYYKYALEAEKEDASG